MAEGAEPPADEIGHSIRKIDTAGARISVYLCIG